MALRLRRDVQKASYYVWFLGAEEAKGLRGHRVIHSVLPYLIDRSRTQESIKVTLQVSHKGIKIIQGSSKHFIPHSAITSSVQTDDIVACVLLLYNPVTKCPLHVHAYRCDSETTAEALNQQLQILINRPENQKRFEDLESRLGIIPGMPSLTSNKIPNHNEEINHKKESKHHDEHHHKQTKSNRHESSSKRMVSSLGSDTGNSTRESECSEDISGNSPMSRSPSGQKPLPLQQHPLPNSELFDSLAAELRAKLNGNGPPLLLPPRDYDTVHRSKGNLTAIELRRCRNQLIVGSNRPGSKTELLQNLPNSSGKQVSSRGSSGIGSDLAPSPERQDIATSSDDEHWSNEADNSVIALKPSQISLERTAPVNQHHINLARKNAVHPRDDSYLRDLPAKPYTPRDKLAPTEKDLRSKTPASNSWTREDEIKPIIVRPSNYDSKINRVLQSEQYAYNHNKHEEISRERAKLPDVEKSNDLPGLLKKNMSLSHDSTDLRYKYKSNNSLDEFEGNHHITHNATHHGYRQENLTDKQKFMEYSTSKSKPLTQTKSYAADEVQKYGGKHRYVDPADLPFEQNSNRDKYIGYRRESHSPDQSELSHRSAERATTTSRDPRGGRDARSVDIVKHHSRDRDRENHSCSTDRNPYREPESIPYIESMEKMMKSSAMRYKSYESNGDLNVGRTKEPLQSKLSQRSKPHSQHDDEIEYNYNYPTHVRQEPYSTSSLNKDRFLETKEKFRALERSGSRFDLADDKDAADYKHRARGTVERLEPKSRTYDDWSDEEHLYDDPPKEIRSRSRSRDQWVEQGSRSSGAIAASKLEVHGRSNHLRDNSGKRGESRSRIDSNDYRDTPCYRDQPHIDHHIRSEEHHVRDRDHSREYTRREYSPDSRSAAERSNRRIDRSMERHRVVDDLYPPTSLSKASPSSSGSGIGAPVPHGKGISNMPKGYRHSYAEPVFSRSAGRVGLAAVNPY